MISALVCLAVLNQKAPAVDYSVPLGASSHFHATVNQVKTRLTAKDFAGASSLAKVLPQSVITYRFNYKKVPKDVLESFKESTSFAIASWQKSLDGKATLVEAKAGVPNLLISFEPVLQKTPDTNEIPGVALFYGATSSEPSVEVVIGLRRTSQLTDTTSTEVFNEVVFGVGSFLGLAPSPVPGSAMGRVNDRMVGLNLVAKDESKLAEANLALAKALRVAAIAKTVVKPLRPQLQISDRVLQFKPAFQGDTVYQFVTVTNNGDAPLKLKAFGDCSCISGDIIPILKPGESTSLKGRYRTEEIVGEIEHNVVLISNDPEQPSQKFPAKIHVEPRAEVIYPDSDTLVFEGEERKFTFYLHSAEPVKWEVKAAQLVPLDSKVVYEPFEGDVSDWKNGGKTKHVKGYKVTTDFSSLKENQVFGRIMMTVFVATSNPNLKVVRAPIFIQKGILAQPERIYLGAPTGPTESTFVLNRPGKPFKIVKTSSDSKHISVQVTQNKQDSDYRITVKYDGKAVEHRLDTQIRIATDDPKQPLILIPVTTAQS